MPSLNGSGTEENLISAVAEDGVLDCVWLTYEGFAREVLQ
jgi:uncharacterized protein YodC (DUF2158 family)